MKLTSQSTLAAQLDFTFDIFPTTSRPRMLVYLRPPDTTEHAYLSREFHGTDNAFDYMNMSS